MRFILFLFAVAVSGLPGPQASALDLPSNPIEAAARVSLATDANQSGCVAAGQIDSRTDQTFNPDASAMMLRVTRVDLVTFSGWLHERTSDRPRIRDSSGALVTVENENILRIEQKRGRRTLIGAALGTAAGFLAASLWAVSYRSNPAGDPNGLEHSHFPTEVFAAFPVAGAVLGGSIGTFIPAYHKVEFENLPMAGVDRARSQGPVSE